MTSYRTAVRTHAGHVRELNEDRALALPERGLWAVADGMGGHARGDHASALVTSRLAALPPTDGGHDLLVAVQSTLAACNRELFEAAARDGLSGCTVVVLLATDGHIACLWAGDSRLYRLRGGELTRLTRDHSLVQELIDRGELTPDAARTHPWRNRITRAVGIDERLELEAVQERVDAGDRFLLCSDGLTGEIGDDEIADLLADATPEASADRLLELTLTKPARDNVTVIVVEPRDDPDSTFPQASSAD